MGSHWACYGLGWDVYRCRKSNRWASDWAEITRKTPKCLAGGDSVGVTLASQLRKTVKTGSWGRLSLGMTQRGRSVPALPIGWTPALRIMYGIHRLCTGSGLDALLPGLRHCRAGSAFQNLVLLCSLLLRSPLFFTLPISCQFCDQQSFCSLMSSVSIQVLRQF